MPGFVKLSGNAGIGMSFKQELVAGSNLRCPRCGLYELRRLQRKGFMQIRIYPLFGYYPWECPGCRELVMIKSRHKGKHRHHRHKPSIGKA